MTTGAKMIPYVRIEPQIPYPIQGTYLYGPYMEVNPPPPFQVSRGQLYFHFPQETGQPS